MSFCTFTPWMCGGEKLCVMVCNCVDVIFCRCSLVESCVWILRNQVEVIVSVATISAAVVSLLLWLLLSKLKLLLASKKGTEVPARDNEVFFLKAVCCMPIQQTAFLKYFHVPCGKLGSPYLVRQSSHKSSATHS